MPSAQRTSSTTGPAHLKCAAISLIVSKEFEVGQRYENQNCRPSGGGGCSAMESPAAAPTELPTKWLSESLTQLLGHERAGYILGPAHTWNGPPDGGAAMLALLTDLECKALREALTTGGGGPAFYCTDAYVPAQPHHTQQSYLRLPPSTQADDYAFGHDPNSDSEDEVDIRDSLSFPPRRREELLQRSNKVSRFYYHTFFCSVTVTSTRQ
jgi:hypothetical protein